MTAKPSEDTPLGHEGPLTLADLVESLESGCKPKDAWRIGTEHEKFGFRQGTFRPVPYEGPDGIRAMLDGLTRFGWNPIYEGENVIALEREGASISLEPGGQFELSGAPLDSLHQTCGEADRHLKEVRAVADELGLGFLGMGFTPTWRRDEIPIMPKGRYDIMRRYMPKVGNLGLDMMLRTCTIQANLDFESEADMVRKFRVSLALQPVATALFANSPFVEGKPSGLLSSRANVWTDTDPDRTGMLDFVFEEGFGFERYVQYALDVPMYFFTREGRYIDAAGLSFRDFIEGRLPVMPGEAARMKDWADHLTTIFPEVRLKKYLEMRGADGGPWARICGLPALWTGVLYDAAALEAAWDVCKHWTAEQRRTLRGDAAKLGLKAEIAGRSLQDVARDVVEIAAEGLKARGRINANMTDERVHLNELREIVESGVTPAERALTLYHGPWAGDASRAFAELAY